MLRFKLHQILLSDRRYLLPLPKLSNGQLQLLCNHLDERGFRVRHGKAPSKRMASKGSQNISVDGALGLASSSSDLLDPLGPAIPIIIAASRPLGEKDREHVAEMYFSLKRAGPWTELQFFPRLESLRIWSRLRRDGLCGLTPDEAFALRHVLGKASSSLKLKCVTAKPREGSRRLQAGRNLYYESEIPIPEFLSSLRTIDSGSTQSASYLPRDSIFSLRGIRLDMSIDARALGEWCSVD